MKRVHKLKIWPQFFEAILSGEKTFEVRSNDRDFQQGEFLQLREFDKTKQSFTGRTLLRRVNYVAKNLHGVDPNFVVMSIERWP
jgi:uncharacterized protein YqfB (UPF0267 family)